MLNRSASLAMSTCVLKALPGKLDIKRHSPSILYVLGPCFVVWFPVSFFVKLSFFYEERAGCFTLSVCLCLFLMVVFDLRPGVVEFPGHTHFRAEH